MAMGEVVQDHYPEDFAHCFGCGRLNRDGHHVRTQMEGDYGVARFTPRLEHIALPGFVYGGLIASLVDCHAIGTAAAAVERAAGREVGEAPAPRFVTGSLRVDYLKPTPLGPEIVLRARAREIGSRKVTVDVAVEVEGVQTARGEVVAVRMPETMKGSGLKA
jgi:acyl-coenzyme A thioesterase PaaI-like protein